MKIRSFYLLFVATLVVSVSVADVVELRDGKRIEGLILAENEDSIEIEVGKNETGTIRQVLIIHASEISSWVADQEGRVSRQKGKEVLRLDGGDYIKRLLKEAGDEMDAGNLNKGIEQYGEAAEIAGRDVDKMEPADQLEALELRAHALRLQLAALEGKSESLEKKSEVMEDQMEEWNKKLEQDIEELKKDKADVTDEQAKDAKQLGQRYKQNDLSLREEKLIQRQKIIRERNAQVDQALADYERDQIKTLTQIKITEEKVDQAEEEAKKAKKALRRR